MSDVVLNSSPNDVEFGIEEEDRGAAGMKLEANKGAQG
jgi:hypothetical protein